MAKLGFPQTSEFSIGSAEVRLAPMTMAGRIPQAYSVGLVDSAALQFTTTSVDLKGLFPQVNVDTAITEQLGTVTIAAREFSRRNLDITLGNAVATAPADVKSTIATTADVPANSSSVTLAAGDGSLFAAGDIISIYPEGRPEDVTVTQVASVAVDTLTLETGMETLVAYNASTETGTTFHVFKAFGIAAGNVTRMNYFSASIIKQKNSTGRPIVWNLWKVANSGGAEESNSNTDYGTLNMELKILMPAASELATGGDLNNVAAWVTQFPLGARFGGADQ